MTHSLDFKLNLIDMVSGGLKKLSTGFRQLDGDVRGASQRISFLPNTLGGLEKHLDTLREKQRNAWTVEGIKAYQREIERTEQRIGNLRKKAGMPIDTPQGGIMSSLAGGAGMALGMVGGAGALTMLGGQAIEKLGQFEQYNAVLRQSLGSRSAAFQAQADIVDFGANTPYLISEITDTFVKLQNQGFAPTMRKMQQLGDFAAFSGKKIDQLGEAILDAQTGEYERLKEFGVKVAVNGKAIDVSFGGQTKTIQGGSRAVAEYVMQLGAMSKIQGSMANIARTTTGQISNLQDKWDILMYNIGNGSRGAIYEAIGALGKLVDTARSWVAVPTATKLQQEAGEMNALVRSITDHNLTAENRLNLLQQLQQQYPEYFGNLDIEKVKNEELLSRLSDVNAQYEKRIKLQQVKDVKQQTQAQLAETQTELNRINLALESLKSGNASDIEYLKSIMTTQEGIWSGASFLLQGNEATITELRKYYMQKRTEAEMQVGRLSGQSGRQGAKEAKLENAQFYADLAAGRGYENVPKNKAEEFRKLKGEYEGVVSQLSSFGDDMAYSRSFQTTLKRANELRAAITALREGEKKQGGNTMGGVTSGGTQGSTSLGTGVDKISGYSGVKNITINVGKFQEKTEIHTNSLPEGKEEVENVLRDMFLRIVNSANSVN